MLGTVRASMEIFLTRRAWISPSCSTFASRVPRDVDRATGGQFRIQRNGSNHGIRRLSSTLLLAANSSRKAPSVSLFDSGDVVDDATNNRSALGRALAFARATSRRSSNFFIGSPHNSVA